MRVARLSGILDHRRVIGQVRPAALGELVEREHPGAVRGAVHGHDGAQLRKPVGQPGEHRDLGVVLDDRDHGARVGHDVCHVLRQRRRVDRRRRAAGAVDRKVGEHPLDPGGREDHDPLLGPQAQREQAGRERAHPLAGLPPAQRAPLLAAAGGGGDGLLEGLRVRRRRHPVEHHPGHRGRPPGCFGHR
jgi:hypothetical protein